MQLIYDTDRIPLVIRLPMLLIGIFCLWFVVALISIHLFRFNLGLSLSREHGSWIAGSMLSAGLGFFFISVWFLRNQFFYDPDRHQIVIKHRGLFGNSFTPVSFKGASGVYIAQGRTRASEFWNIGIELSNEKKKWLTRIHDKAEADKVISVFSRFTGLPVLNR